MYHNVTLFQFHNGSIKSDENTCDSKALSEFQFHNGSIKRAAPSIPRPLDARFQFHNGSIKRGRNPIPWAVTRPRFNSIMVRLKAAQAPPVANPASVSIP